MKRIISILFVIMTTLSLIFAPSCQWMPNFGNGGDEQQEQEHTGRDVYEYGAELNKQFKLPSDILAKGGLKLTKANGQNTDLAFDSEGKIVFNEIGDYKLTYNGGFITICVRDTQAPIFTYVLRDDFGIVGVPYDLSRLTKAVDNSGLVSYSYEVKFLSAFDVELASDHTFIPTQIGYYSVKTIAKDASGNMFSTTARVEVTALEENEIAFFNNETLQITNTNSNLSGYSSEGEPRMGDSGKSLKINVKTPDNYAAITSGVDLTNVNEVYFYVYFDSTSFKYPDGTPVAKEDLLPLNKNVFPKPNIGSTSVWTTNVCSADVALEYDTWILVKSTLNEGSANLTDTMRFYISNYRGTWEPNSWDWTNTPYYLYNVYIDNVMLPKAHGKNEIAYFNDVDATATKNGSPVGLSEEIRMGDSGKSLYVKVSGNDNYVVTTGFQDLSQLSEVYYYVYFDSKSFTDANGNALTTLPKLTTAVLPKLQTKNENGGTINISTQKVTNLDPLEYDKWIRVISTFEKGSLTNCGRNVTFYLSNYTASWLNNGSWTSSGYKYTVYIDTIYKGEPGWAPWGEL